MSTSSVQKFFTRFKALCSIASASWGPSKEFLFQLYKAIIQLVLSYASSGWFPFLCDILKKDLEVYHRSACRVISGCLASTSAQKLLLESLTHPLEITLYNQALVFCERALRFPADNFPLQQLASRSVLSRIKKRPFWRSFCSSQKNQAPREKLIF